MSGVAALGAFGKGIASGMSFRSDKKDRDAINARLDRLIDGGPSGAGAGTAGPMPMGAGANIGTPGGTPDSNIPWIRYSTEGATRNLPVSSRLVDAMRFLPEIGVEMEVFSAGQPRKGTSDRRVGSTRHDDGEAADVFFAKGGRRLDWSNPDDVPIFQDIVRRAKANGLTGFGAGPGYMQPGSMHIGFGEPAVWGAGGRGANAPDWLRQAYATAAAEAAAQGQPKPTVASVMNRWPRPLGVGPM